MTERRMTEVVREAHGFDEIAVDEKVAAHRRTARPEERADRTADLGDFHRVRQPRTVEIILPGKKNLRLRLQFPKRMRMNDPIAIHLEGRPVVALAGAAKRLAVEGVVEPVLHRAVAANTNLSRRTMQSRSAAAKNSRRTITGVANVLLTLHLDRAAPRICPTLPSVPLSASARSRGTTSGSRVFSSPIRSVPRVTPKPTRLRGWVKSSTG